MLPESTSLQNNTSGYLHFAWVIPYGLAGLGMEMLGGKYISLAGAREVVYAVIYTTEEALEMLGIALFIYALMR